MKYILFFLVILFVTSSGCTNNNLPESVKGVIAYKEGSDGFRLYVILADKEGKPTSADGLFTFDIECNRINGRKETYHAYRGTKNVKESDFDEATAPLGPFDKDILLYSFGRVPYSVFGEQLPWIKFPELIREDSVIKIQFTPAKGLKQIRGETPISF